MESTFGSENILQIISRLSLALENSGLKKDKLKGTLGDTRKVANFMGITRRQAHLFAAFFAYQVKENSVNLGEIAQYLHIPHIEMLGYYADFKELKDKGIFEMDDSLCFSSAIMNLEYRIPKSILDCLYRDKPLGVITPPPPLDHYKFVKVVSDIIDQRDNGIICTELMLMEISELEERNPQVGLSSRLSEISVGIDDRSLFYEICDDTIAGGKTGLTLTMKDMYDDMSERLKRTSALLDGKSPLIVNELVQVTEAQYVQEATVELTEKGLEWFFGPEARMYMKKTEMKVIKPETLTKKDLFYDGELNKQVKFLHDSLEDQQFRNLQERLDGLGMPKGITAILYGDPGTGKTASVYEIARATNRGIYHIDISETKSMWFGQSEKKIKEIFTDYRLMCKQSAIKPILLFNEADAVLGKRKESMNSSVDQTENTIQSILLEEFEKNENIIVCTTNLQGNLDPAFERRFLFKIRFSKPSVDVKRLIWKSKLSWIDDHLASQLATQFSFSGGEIDNIVRKIVMEEVLTGIRPDFGQIMDFCRAEKLFSNGTRRKMGFVNDII